VFTTQIRAILRAACYGPMRVLVPMITQPDELIAVRTLFKLARQELKQEGVDLPEKLPLGAMIEVPAAAITVRALLEHADFLAIGTNDLAQYVLAADRGNDALENVYNPLHPALLRLICHVISAGRRVGKSVSLCGEIGGDVNFTALLLALGLGEFSMHPSQILQVRDRLGELDRSELRRLAPQLIRAHTHEQVEALLATLDSALPA
jgi:phosphoenolpyruvate-protein phosphotransferase (PTS system enzyme I)